jgi:ubiquinone/menaquinone biosynthesis C-methylase UbiE
MKKYFIAVLCAIFFAVPSISLNRQNQEHEHKHTGLKQYEERQKRYENRWYWQMPLRVMEELGVGPGMSVADVGAGIGYFTLRLAKKVGETGKVYASDIDGNALSFLDGRRKQAGLDNIVIIHGKDDDPMIPESSVDLVLIVNTIQLVKEKTVFLNNISNSLKENGKLVFVQWDAEKMDSEMPSWDCEDRERYTVRTMLKMIYDAGYEVLAIKDFLPMQLIYICQLSNASDKMIKDRMTEHGLTVRPENIK